MEPFKSYTPSVFIITSPFQALCSIAAIKNLKIDDYLIIFIAASSEARNEQTINFLKRYEASYKIISPNLMCRLPYFVKAIIPKNTKYKRLFIGDFRNYGALYLGLGFVSKNSDVVYLDDGNISISLLEGTYHKKNGKAIKVNECLTSILASWQKVIPQMNLYTIYGNIFNPNFNVAENDLSVVLKNVDNVQTTGVFVIGTVIETYCEHLGLSTDSFTEKMDLLFKKLSGKYPNEEITYIAHGRDDGSMSIPICQKNGIRFLRPELVVELFMLGISNIPRLIMGFNSSALYNLKKMMPSCEVRNVLIISNRQTSQTDRYRSVASYYVKNDISTDEIKVN